MRWSFSNSYTKVINKWHNDLSGEYKARKILQKRIKIDVRLNYLRFSTLKIVDYLYYSYTFWYAFERHRLINNDREMLWMELRIRVFLITVLFHGQHKRFYVLYLYYLYWCWSVGLHVISQESISNVQLDLHQLFPFPWNAKTNLHLRLCFLLTEYPRKQSQGIYSFHVQKLNTT